MGRISQRDQRGWMEQGQQHLSRQWLRQARRHTHWRIRSPLIVPSPSCQRRGAGQDAEYLYQDWFLAISKNRANGPCLSDAALPTRQPCDGWPGVGQRLFPANSSTCAYSSFCVPPGGSTSS
jgi:hypothetical protein